MGKFGTFLLAIIVLNSQGQISEQKFTCIEICNCYSNQREINLSIEIIPYFNIFDTQREAINLSHGRCRLSKFRIDIPQTANLYIEGQQRKFHVIPGELLTVEIYSSEELTFLNYNKRYTEYTNLMPIQSLSELQKFRSILPPVIYAFEYSEIQFNSLNKRFYSLPFARKIEVSDSILGSHFDFNQSALLNSKAYFSFLDSFFFFLYERKFNQVIDGYGDMSFSQKETERENYYKKEMELIPVKNQRIYSDSVNMEYWFNRFSEASKLLEPKFFDYFVYTRTMEMFRGRPSTYANEHLAYCSLNIKNDFLLERIKAIYSTYVSPSNSHPNNVFRQRKR